MKTNLINQSGNFRATVLQYPSKKFGFVGSIPANVLIEKTNHLGQKYMASPIFETRQEIEAFAKENNIRI